MKELLSKFGSGRLFLTIICGISFLYCVTHKILTAESITSIITMVFVSYFQRPDRTQQGGQK